MQTILTIDDNLFAEAARLTSIQNQELLIKMALIKLIEHHRITKKTNLLDLYGVGGISEDYDYKKLRSGENNDALS